MKNTPWIIFTPLRHFLAVFRYGIMHITSVLQNQEEAPGVKVSHLSKADLLSVL